MINFLSLFLLPIVLMMMIAIIVIAVIKKLNVVVWTVLTIVGFLLCNLLVYILLFSHRMMIVIPFGYLLILLIAVVLTKGKTKSINTSKCSQCQTVVKQGMIYCPNCGANLNN